MSGHIGQLLAGAVVLLLTVVGCTGSADDPAAPAQLSVTCELGCNETDPSPSSPGIFLGSGVTNLTCFDGEQTDSDGDGMSDFCESNIAPVFAPQLAFSPGDQVGREPHLAVRRLTSTAKARIMYMMSYYVDAGPTTSWCNNNIIDNFNKAACHGHDGDSEWIALDVYYNTTTQHWILDQATYSQHTGSTTYTRGTHAYPVMEYATKSGGAPRAYVSYQKHANYATDAECDQGAFIGTDVCNANTFQQVVAGYGVNIRSRAAHTSSQDCAPSTNPIYSGNGVTECYWTTRDFTGWHVGTASHPSDYSSKLTAQGF